MQRCPMAEFWFVWVPWMLWLLRHQMPTDYYKVMRDSFVLANKTLIRSSKLSVGRISTSRALSFAPNGWYTCTSCLCSYLVHSTTTLVKRGHVVLDQQMGLRRHSFKGSNLWELRNVSVLLFLQLTFTLQQRPTSFAISATVRH